MRVSTLLRPTLHFLAWLGVVVLLAGCATYRRHGLDAEHARQAEASLVNRQAALSPAAQDRILALDAEHVTARDVREALSNAPAPQVLNLHGGIYPVHQYMVSFSEFLVGMGYPAGSIRNPADGTYSYSCYESSAMIAGVAAWYYEKTGLRPMLIGHSQGGMQAVKVLYQLAGRYSAKLHVWNPCSWTREERCTLTDPLTGLDQPVVGLKLAYATAVGAGGFTRILPNQWDTLTRLRSIPDSVEEFTGFSHQLDPIGGDLLGFSPVNRYRASGSAVVRNVRLPVGYSHVTVPNTRHLVKSQPIMDWINNYTPSEHPKCEAEFDASSKNILWAADVWYSVKKHWVLELQRLIRAQRAGSPPAMRPPAGRDAG
jgi:pimeloyl-ACP methyl ester carboxylesterase